MTEFHPHNDATSENREEFWDRLEDCRTGMMEVDKGFVPMTHNLEPEDGNIWFLTAHGTAMAEAAAAGAATRYIVCNDAESVYATIEGQLSVSTDKAKLDEVWNVMASAWYEEGKEDPDLVLVKLRPSQAEVWLGPESGVKFLFSVAKAKLTGDEPDMGSHFKLAF